MYYPRLLPLWDVTGVKQLETLLAYFREALSVQDSINTSG